MTDLSGTLEIDPIMVEALGNFQASRMGIYEHVGVEGGKVHLRELLTDDEFPCHCPAGYTGNKGELWYVRLCPPMGNLFDCHVATTTPYILLEANKADWVAYLNRRIVGVADQRQALHDHLKYGPTLRYWPEFVFQACHHYQKEAIFLKGLPDVLGSRPHGPRRVGCRRASRRSPRAEAQAKEEETPTA